MEAVKSWIEKQFQGSNTERSLERIFLTMGIRQAGKAASELANTASKSSMDSISTHCLFYGIPTAHDTHIYGHPGK